MHLAEADSRKWVAVPGDRLPSYSGRRRNANNPACNYFLRMASTVATAIG